MARLACDICDLEFGSNDGLMSHIFLLHNGLPLQIIADNDQITISTLETAKESKVDKENIDPVHEDNPVTNVTDSKRHSVTNVIDSKRHRVTKPVKKKKTKGKGSYKCDKCPLGFHSPSGLRYHFRTKHDSQKMTFRQFKCNHCKTGKVRFVIQADLTQHLNAAHDGKPNIVCHLCQRGFITKSDLTRHVKFIHYKVPRPYKYNK